MGAALKARFLEQLRELEKISSSAETRTSNAAETILAGDDVPPSGGGVDLVADATGEEQSQSRGGIFLGVGGGRASSSSDGRNASSVGSTRASSAGRHSVDERGPSATGGIRLGGGGYRKTTADPGSSTSADRALCGPQTATNSFMDVGVSEGGSCVAPEVALHALSTTASARLRAMWDIFTGALTRWGGDFGNLDFGSWNAGPNVDVGVVEGTDSLAAGSTPARFCERVSSCSRVSRIEQTNERNRVFGPCRSPSRRLMERFSR